MPASKKVPNINLVIRDELGESFSGQVLSWALTYGRYIIILTQIVVLSVFFLRFKLDRDHTDLKESTTQKAAIIESVADLEANIRHVQGRLANIRQISTNQDGLLKALLFFQDNIPSDISFSTLNLTNEKISFGATAGSLRSFSFLLAELQKNERFSEVTLDEILRRPDGRIEFRIKAKINLKAFI